MKNYRLYSIGRQMANNYNDDNYEKLALKYNLPVKVIKAVVESQFEASREVMKNYNKEDPNTYKNIRWMHLGLLIAKKKKKKENE